MKPRRYVTTATKPCKLTVMLGKDDQRKLRELATKEDVGVSQMVRLMVRRFYEARAAYRVHSVPVTSKGGG